MIDDEQLSIHYEKVTEYELPMELSDYESIMSDQDLMLSTEDNPFNPFEDYDRWYAFDNDKGYNTIEKVVRLADLQLNEDDYTTRLKSTRSILTLLQDDTDEIYVLYTKKHEEEPEDDWIIEE